ncbi:arginine--tRNA ligase [Paenarthrobacter nitroguajacolicus]|uniref:arginine--tRNA ligase n=1 Tax=Paenarthrobacter nitroguajacolicus TaxID=211146 RepID=UPI0015B82469|nr:arginine--tRNA ligase [Paenarthrobacter nitroguajacolicus]
MISPFSAVRPLAQKAISGILGLPAADIDPVVRESQFADLQLNAALALSRRHGMTPMELAQLIADALGGEPLIAEATASKPGYVNIVLADSWIEQQIRDLSIPTRLDPSGRRVVVDYSSPNVAKEMHVGHLRTTVVGDALVRILDWLGNDVIKQNHIGDWGTPFGMLIEHALDAKSSGQDAHELAEDPNAFYQAAREKFDADEDFATRARLRVVLLQAGDEATLSLWSDLVGESKTYFNKVYAALEVSLRDEDLAGESTYNAQLPLLCEDLEKIGLATVSEGALCAFPEGFKGRDNQPAALILRKSDGGYGYATTDVAALKYRVQELKADSVVYVVGSPQANHLEMVWQLTREAGWLTPATDVTHVKIGNVLGPDNKILRTRSGKSFKLLDLVDEAVARAHKVLVESSSLESPEEMQAVARMIGTGAVKYADLSVAHDTEYIFDLDRMVSLSGNTAPYLQYAVARIRSLIERGERTSQVTNTVVISLPEERQLAMSLLNFEAAVETAGEKLEPHRLCAYLFALTQRFSSFYDAAPVLNAEDDARSSRLALCRATEQVLVQGLSLLGIRAPQRM